MNTARLTLNRMLCIGLLLVVVPTPPSLSASDSVPRVYRLPEPGTLGWGPNDQAYPDKFVVYRDGSEMVWVPPGEFVRGQKVIRITKGFWMHKHQVTNAQYRAFCEATRREFPEESDQGDDHPVVWVSWDDAVAYAEHYGLSLPTEAQWEYAAYGPKRTVYVWGSEFDGSRLCWRGNQGPGGRTFPVGSFPEGASWVGALDMAGNVYEWCADWYAIGADPAGRVDDPMGPAQGLGIRLNAPGLLPGESGPFRVVRGGSYLSLLPRDFRVDYRPIPLAYSLLDDFGFRCIGVPQ